MGRGDEAAGSGEAGASRLAPLRRNLAALLVLLLGCGLSLAGWQWLRAADRAALAAGFALDAEGYAGAVRQHLGEHEGLLQAIADLRTLSRPLTRDDFRAFTGPQRAAHAGVRALAWLPRLPAAQRAAFEAEASDDIPGYRLSELDASGARVAAGSRPDYYPVRLVEPRQGNEGLLGLDAGSQPRLRTALEQARDRSGFSAVTDLALLPQPDRPPGYLLSLAVYRGGRPSADQAASDEALEGYIVGEFGVAELVETAIGHVPGRGLDIWVLAGAAPAPQRLLYFHPSRTRRPAEPPPTLAQALAGAHHRVALELPGARWSLLFSPAPGYPRPASRAVLVLVTGLLLSSALAAYLAQSSWQRARLQRFAEALRREKAEVQGANQALRESQARMQQQLDQLRRFEKLALGRELRVKELADDNHALRLKLSASKASP